MENKKIKSVKILKDFLVVWNYEEAKIGLCYGIGLEKMKRIHFESKENIKDKQFIELFQWMLENDKKMGFYWIVNHINKYGNNNGYVCYVYFFNELIEKKLIEVEYEQDKVEKFVNDNFDSWLELNYDSDLCKNCEKYNKGCVDKDCRPQLIKKIKELLNEK